MKTQIIAAALLLVALATTPVLAENDANGHPVQRTARPNPMPTPQQQPQMLDPITATVGVNWRNLESAISQALTANVQKDAMIAEMTKHQSDMEEYLKACGDKPGCTQPVTPK